MYSRPLVDYKIDDKSYKNGNAIRYMTRGARELMKETRRWTWPIEEICEFAGLDPDKMHKALVHRPDHRARRHVRTKPDKHGRLVYHETMKRVFLEAP